MVGGLAFESVYAPDINALKNMTADQKNGWGNLMDSEYLSIIISSEP